MNIEKIKEKARIKAYYTGLNYRLVQISHELARIEASEEQDRMYPEETKEAEAVYRGMYRKRLLNESAEIRKITETPIVKKAEP